MRRIAQLILLKEEFRDEYIRYHQAVWPGVLAIIERAHIRNYSIFLHGNVLIACLEYHGEDYDADMRQLASEPEMQRWWQIMDPMQDPLPELAEGKRWMEVPEVFRFDGPHLGAQDKTDQSALAGDAQ